MTEMQIDKNIPKPPKKQKQKSDRGPGADRKYPFPDMAIGDSFFKECSEFELDQKRQNLASACNAYKKKNPSYNFSVRKVEGGVRVWRVEVVKKPF